MKLHWWVWIAVGLPVLIVSSMMDLGIFVIVGAIFLIIGTAQLIHLFVLSPRVSKSERRVVQPTQLRCPRCKVSVEQGDFFCRLCGQRLR